MRNTLLRAPVGEGKIARKVIRLSVELLNRERPQYTFCEDDALMIGTRGAWRHIDKDCESWQVQAEGVFSKTGSRATFAVSSTDTMTKCARYGLVELERGDVCFLEVLAAVPTDVSPRTTREDGEE